MRLNRPDKLNALDGDMFVALVDASARLARDTSVRAVVLSGEGRAFSAGLDFSGFMAMAGGRVTVDAGGPASRADAGTAERAGESPAGGDLGAIGRTDGRITHLGQQAAHGWSEVPVPVIAAVHGHCLGGGLQIALGADIRIVHPDAKLSVLEIRWGLSPDMTGTATLPRLVGLDVAKELTWTGRNVSGRRGRARSAWPPARATTRSTTPWRWPATSPAESPHAIRGAKRLLDQSGRVPLAQQYADERHTIGVADRHAQPGRGGRRLLREARPVLRRPG